MFGKSSKRGKTRKARAKGRKPVDSAAALSKGIVTVSICAGACLWGYALINLATRTS